MKRPKKKHCHWVATDTCSYFIDGKEVNFGKYSQQLGANKVIDDIDTCLPSNSELHELIAPNGLLRNIPKGIEAISKRIRE